MSHGKLRQYLFKFSICAVWYPQEPMCFHLIHYPHLTVLSHHPTERGVTLLIQTFGGIIVQSPAVEQSLPLRPLPS